MNEVVTQLERGDLRLRVRVLESEAALARIEAVQGSLTAAVMATLLLNAGVALASCTVTGTAAVGSRALFALAALFGFQVPMGYFQVSPTQSYGVFVAVAALMLADRLWCRPRLPPSPSHVRESLTDPCILVRQRGELVPEKDGFLAAGLVWLSVPSREDGTQ